MSWSLPKLPGYSFQDPTRTRFHVPRKFEYINGFRIPRTDHIGLGGVPVDTEGSGHVDIAETCNFDPTLTYGRVQQPSLPVTLPKYVHYDKKALTFRGFLKQSIAESPLEHYRVRPVTLVYYLEDDTLTVIEPYVKNSGLWQGRMVKRGKILKNNSGESWHWKDLNVGIDICIFGNVFHTVSCDDYTKEFMVSQGIELAEEEEMPDDPYTVAQTQRRDGPHPRNVTTPSDNNLKRFLQYDGKVLRFEAVWDDRETECGEMRKYQIFYYLYDDTMAVKECYSKNGGRDQFPMLLKKIRIPKNWRERMVDTPLISHEPVITKDNEGDFYNPYDLIVGNMITILGRQFLLYDCDYFTRNYYKNVLNIEQGEPVCLPDNEEKTMPRQIPPHIGIGDPEDTLLSCFTFHSKSPRKDIIQYNLNANKFLRYLCEMVSVYPEDQGRKFILAYHLADGTIRVDEMPIRNSGLIAGRFSGPGRVRVPHSNDFYTPEKFYIGALVVINRHRFRIKGVDLFVYRYMIENPSKFTPSVIDNIRTHLLLEGKLTENTQLFRLTPSSELCFKRAFEQAYIPHLDRVHNPSYYVLNAPNTSPRPNESNISPDKAEQCLQDVDVDREVSEAAVNNPYYDEGLGHGEHADHLKRRMDPCALPPPLQGLDSFKSMSFLDNANKIPERREQPIVCLSGPSVSHQGYLDESDSLAKAVDETSRMDSINCANQLRSPQSPNQVIAAGKPTKMVTFAELPMFNRRRPAPED